MTSQAAMTLTPSLTWFILCGTTSEVILPEDEDLLSLEEATIFSKGQEVMKSLIHGVASSSSSSNGDQLDQPLAET